VKEIIFNNYGLKPWEALFIDEEFIIAQASKDLLVPFIGMSTGFDYSYQKQEMEKLGVKYLIHSLDEIDSEYLECIQREVTNGKIWTKI